LTIQKATLVDATVALKQKFFSFTLRDSMATNEKTPETSENKRPSAEQPDTRVKFEIYGEEMIEKSVKSSGNSGRVYLPPNWVGHQVKIIRID
jgi:putative transposon-encoded protein